MASKTSKVSEAINFGNGAVNGANAVNAADPNHPEKDLTSKDWINGLSGAYGYLDNLFQFGGKSLPYVNAASIFRRSPSARQNKTDGRNPKKHIFLFRQSGTFKPKRLILPSSSNSFTVNTKSPISIRSPATQ